MAQNDEETDKFIVEFTVRNDQYRGILIEQLEYNDDIYFFKHHDMPLQNHCEQIRRIVGSVGVKRTKIIRVDTTEFSYEYFAQGVPCFKCCALNSTKQQMKKIADSNINKEIGAKKRSVTVAQNKGRKQEARKNTIWERMQQADDYYREERQKRMDDMFAADVSQNQTFASTQVRKIVLPTMSETLSAALPAATVHPSLEFQIDSQQPANHLMDQELPGNDEDL